MQVIIGWTITGQDPTREYIPMDDGWKPGARQHSIAIDVNTTLTDEWVCEAVFEATNCETGGAPLVESIRAAIKATGYRGEQGGHYSLSVGDTITVDGRRWACESFGWKHTGETTLSRLLLVDDGAQIRYTYQDENNRPVTVIGTKGRAVGMPDLGNAGYAIDNGQPELVALSRYAMVEVL